MKMKNSIRFANRFVVLTLCALAAIAMLAPTGTWAAVVTTAGSGNWSSTTLNAPWPGGTIPATTDSIIVASGHNLTHDSARTCAGMTVNGGGTLTLPTGNLTLTVNGDVSGLALYLRG